MPQIRTSNIIIVAALLSMTACVRLVPDARIAAGDGSPKLKTQRGEYVSPPAPVWDGGHVVRNAKKVRQGYYTVKRGDTLRGIGNRTGAGSEAIAAANQLAKPYNLYTWQRLLIPGGRYHRVGAADTGIAIAAAYGVSWLDVIEENDLEEPYILRIGQRLRLPGTAYDPDRALRQRAAAFDVGIAEIASGSQPAIAEGARPQAAQAARARPAVPLDSAVEVPKYFGGTFRWPLPGPIMERYGDLYEGGASEGKKNEGIDIAAPVGANVVASAPGTVVYSGNGVGVVGGLVLIDHGGGWVTAYGRLGKLFVVRGDSVGKGQAIGTVGDTGYGKGPNLHFEIRRDLKPVDPLLHLPPQ